jgi:asparagine synthase (glutamine-hydrolysing)
MCGIVGRVNFISGAPVVTDRIWQMCALVAHRGPDGQHVMTRDHVGLGHVRLAIIDLSPAGRQPMSAADGRIWVTFNGEIYNFQELRAELEGLGHRFETKTDTEVLLKAYLQYDVRCLDHLRGMFAFALWDGRTRTLFIARDRVGKKPLHYRIDDDGIAFASEPKAFLAEPEFVPDVDVAAISHYLTYQFVPSPHSAFRDVRKLPPAHYLLVRDGQVRVERYWSLAYTPKLRISEEEACDELMRRFEEAVRLRMISDVPLGAFLSGGIDSSATVAMMARLSGQPVKTYSIGFAEADYDELPFARQVAQRYATDHHEFVVRPDATEVLDKLVWHYNEPYADESALPTYLLAQLTRQHVTVALNGDGGDESFAGYERYMTDAILDAYSRLPRPLRQGAWRVASGLPEWGGPGGLTARGRRWTERGAETMDQRYARRLTYIDRRLKGTLCTPEFLRAAGTGDSEEILLDALRGETVAGTVDQFMRADISVYLPDCLLVKVDIASMAHGLEARSPLLDHEVMEFAASLPIELKLRDGEKKYLFKKALAPLLPPEILTRRKMGFGVPIEHWFRGALRDLTRDVLLGAAATSRGYFRRDVVERWIDEHERGTRSWHDHLWTLLMLELWHQRFIDDRSSARATAASRVAQSVAAS